MSRTSTLRFSARASRELLIWWSKFFRQVRRVGTSAKLRLYADFGIAEYWIVDPGHETFEFLENSADGFRLRLPVGGWYRSAAIAGLELDLEAFWRAIPR